MNFYDTEFYGGIAHAITRLQQRAAVYSASAREHFDRARAQPDHMELAYEHQARARWYYECARELHHGGDA